jgi:hypothetical protein
MGGPGILREREREREKEIWEGSGRHYQLRGGEE